MSSHNSVAALSSGGLDSAVMLAELASTHESVHPIYVRCNLVWEGAELRFLQKFLAALHHPSMQKLTALHFDMEDVYAREWYATGIGVPGYHEADENWHIPGRNLILTAKTAVWCRLKGVNRIAHGTLAANPFGDASAGFFSALERVLSQGLDHPLRIVTPFGSLTKADVIRRGRHLPLELTLSCATPVGEAHCGLCGKCRERIAAFAEAEVKDPTRYERHYRKESPELKA